MSGGSGLAGVVTSLLSINETKKANKEQKRQNDILQKQIADDKADALKKRKQVIDEQRYNLLGSSDSSSSSTSSSSGSTTSSSGFNLLDNETLG